MVPLIIVSWGEFDNRGQVNEIYGETHENVWSDFLAYYNEKKLDQKSYFRVDILTKEKLVSFEELKEVIGRIKRNNYGDFNFRVVGKNSVVFKGGINWKCYFKTKQKTQSGTKSS